jgi:hypothetical protein
VDNFFRSFGFGAQRSTVLSNYIFSCLFVSTLHNTLATHLDIGAGSRGERKKSSSSLRIISRNNNDRIQVDVENLDLTDPTAIQKWFDSHSVIPDICIHTAALSSPGVCQEDPESAMKINVPKHFFDALFAQNKHLTIIALSTDQVYEGTNPPYKDADSLQEQPPQPCNVYGNSKLEMEQELLLHQKATIIILYSCAVVSFWDQRHRCYPLMEPFCTFVNHTDNTTKKQPFSPTNVEVSFPYKMLSRPLPGLSIIIIIIIIAVITVVFTIWVDPTLQSLGHGSSSLLTFSIRCQQFSRG